MGGHLLAAHFLWDEEQLNPKFDYKTELLPTVFYQITLRFYFVSFD